jgi:hypothetical protein
MNATPERDRKLVFRKFLLVFIVCSVANFEFPGPIPGSGSAGLQAGVRDAISDFSAAVVIAK